MGKYLIFGATGSIGSKLSENMHEQDKEGYINITKDKKLKIIFIALIFRHQSVKSISK